MLDRKFIVENAEAVRKNCQLRGAKVDLDRFLELEARRKALDPKLNDLKRDANEASKKIKSASPEERPQLIAASKELKQQVAETEKEQEAVASEMDELRALMPNMTHPDAPVGADDQANTEVRRGKTPLPEFDFPPLDHLELGEKLGIIDMESGAKVAGAGFYFLRGDAALLELALQKYALDTLLPEGFTPFITPDLAKNEILNGTGYIPRGPETQIYSIENTDLSLIATAEITLGGLLAGQILGEDELPLKFCGISHCFRTEAGSHGRASRGLYRVHQFTKIEMFAFTVPEQSDAMLDHLCDLECRLFDGLGIPYRVVDTATGDLGGPAYRKFDLEAWMPGRGETDDSGRRSGEFGEITSTSNCTDYQARRLKIRFRRKETKENELIHTLNGTAIAISRAIIAILENYQQADGSVRIPAVLQPYMGKEVIEPKA